VSCRKSLDVEKPGTQHLVNRRFGGHIIKVLIIKPSGPTLRAFLVA
jgi:hypothetical protein